MRVSFKITRSTEKVLFSHNLGKYVWFENRIYEGDWEHNRMHGKGKITWVDGRCYEG
jgi:hypothetical protein